MQENPNIEIDLSAARQSAERVRAMLIRLRQRLDLSPFEYCKEVRISPTEIPFSHPRITLNSFVFSELGLAAMYLHEQMHWYASWFSHSHASPWRQLFGRLRGRYPSVPAIEAGGAQDESSTYLHLMVNWLELEAVSRFFPREQVERHLRALPFYQWIYQTVIAEQESLGSLYRELGLSPIRAATEMSTDDLKLAARPDEADGS
jgi:hypothetical protein